MVLPAASAKRSRAGPGRGKAATMTKSRNSTAARAAIASSSSLQNREPTFPWHSLPKELQLQIFHMIFLDPQIIIRTQFNRKPGRGYESSTNYRYVSRDVTSFLLTCQSFYNEFGPLYWQNSTVYFRDPITMANDFLAFASPAAYNNLRHMHYTFETTGFDFYSPPRFSSFTRAREVRKLGDIQALESLHIKMALVNPLQRAMMEAVHRNPLRRSADALWKLADRQYCSCFSRFEKRVTKNTFKDFHVYKSVTELDHGVSGQEFWAQSLHMEFSKAAISN